MKKPQNYLTLLLLAVLLVAFTSVNLSYEEQTITGAIAGKVSFTILPKEVPPIPPVPGAGGPISVVTRPPVYLPPKPTYYIGNLDIEYEYDFYPYPNEFWVYTYRAKNYTLELLTFEGNEFVEFQLFETKEIFSLGEGETIQIDTDQDGENDVFIYAIEIGPLTERPLIRIYLERPLLPPITIVHFSTFILLAVLVAILSAAVGYFFATTEMDLVRICGRCGSTSIKQIVKVNKKEEEKSPDTKHKFKDPHKCLNCGHKGKFFPVVNRRHLSKLQEEIDGLERTKSLRYPYIPVQEKLDVCGRCGSTNVLTISNFLKRKVWHCQTCEHIGRFFFEVPYQKAIKLQKEIKKLRSDRSYYNSRRNTNLKKRRNK